MTRGGDTRAPYQDLVALYVPVAAVVFVLVVAALGIVLVRYRARGDGRRPSAQASAPRLELAYAAVLVVVATVLLWRSFAELSPASPPRAVRGAVTASAASPELTIGLVASQWNWRALYPGGVVQYGDGHARPTTLVVPAGRTVNFRLTSGDVVHALWIPALRVKYDAMPRWVNTFAVRFAAGLDYSTTRCSEFCGELHDEMVLRVDVRSPASFDAWLRAREEALRR